MKYELVLVRYGEIALKGKETRKHFESILVKNIKLALKKNNITNKVVRERGRIYVYTNKIEQSLFVLKKIFGITSVSPAVQTSSDLDFISKLALIVSNKGLTRKNTFAIRATRTGQHNFTSQDVAVKIGNDIVKATKAIVNLTKPDLELFIEIRNDKTFIFTEKIRAVGGMPFGSQGRVLALIDDEYSILAAWYLIRRGCKIIFVIKKEKYRRLLEIFSNNWHIKPEVYIIKSGKTFFENLNKTLLEKNCDAVVTDRSILHSSTKIMKELKSLKKQIDVPVLHPLISMDKKELIKKYKEIMSQK